MPASTLKHPSSSHHTHHHHGPSPAPQSPGRPQRHDTPWADWRPFLYTKVNNKLMWLTLAHLLPLGQSWVTGSLQGQTAHGPGNCRAHQLLKGRHRHMDAINKAVHTMTGRKNRAETSHWLLPPTDAASPVCSLGGRTVGRSPGPAVECPSCTTTEHLTLRNH